MKTPAIALSISPGPRRLARLALWVLVPTVVIWGAIGPNALEHALHQASAIHLHWPRFQLLVEGGPVVQLHLLCVTLALAIGIVLLAGVKGSAVHRMLGWFWVAAMFTGAASSFFIRTVNHGSLSFIHALSGWVVIALPMAVVAVRRRKTRLHARLMTGLFTGGLILAGAFAFIPGRLMWDLFFR